LHEQYPAYDFATHKGYITRDHARALSEHGACAEHRRRFSNVRAAIAGDVEVALESADADMVGAGQR
ncbi:MAG: ribonuclease HII, partial [Actinomycetia bacterium]|nr:ribonuclease HII [Actinomycetes bacterium]